LAAEIGTTMPKMAIAWCLKNENVSTAILGASKVNQLEETLTAIDDVKLLTAEVMGEISEILDNDPMRPDF
jgi:aryl-alcohol dehydrogenase-like predicted oxidoreductase